MTEKSKNNINKIGTTKVCNKKEKTIENMDLKSNKAVTLIALVVTIVILLILARYKYCSIKRR